MSLNPVVIEDDINGNEVLSETEKGE